jgi:two-component system response regulator NreC
MSEPGPPRVVVVDDHPLFRRGIVDLLMRDGAYLVVGEASSLDDITGLIHRAKPAAALLDIRLGKESALAVIPAVRTTCPDVRIIVVTMYDQPAFRRAAHAAGAHGYVTKRDADTEILIALRQVLSGGTYFPAVDDDRMESGRFGTLPVLAPREIEVVRHVARGHTNRAIADKLEISIKSVESYRARVMQKLGFSSRVDLVRYALELGLVGAGETPAIDD